MAEIKILIVEDEQLIALELENRITRLGYIVCGKAADTREALEATRNCKPDLILMDIRLEGEPDGIETAKQILAMGHYPIIYVTAFADKATLDRAKETMPYGYLSKPVQERDLRVTIEMALHKNKIEKELKNAKKELELSEHRNRILINAMPDLFFSITREGTILDYNAPSAELLLLPPDKFLNKKITEILPETICSQAMPAIEKSIDNNSVEPFEYEALLNNQQTYYEARANKLDENTALVVIRDITKQKQAERKNVKLNRLYLVRSNINQSITRIHDPEKLFREVCRIAVEDGKFVMAWIGILNSETNKVKVAASFGKVNGYLDNINIDLNVEPLNLGPTSEAIQSGKYNYCGDIENDVRMAPWRQKALELGYRSSISLPLKMFGKNYGAISIYSGEVDFFGDKEEIKLLEELTANISFALEFMAQDSRRKQVEDALKKSEERFRSLYENSTMGLYRTTPDGQILLANPTLVKMLGFDSFEELVKRDLAKVSYTDRAKRIEFQQYFEENDELRGFESEWFCNDGSVVSVSESTKAVKDETGKIIYYDGTVEDITRRKLAEKQLTESEEKYRLLAESSPEMIYLVDTEGYVTYVNKTAAAQFRAPARKIIGKHLTDIFPPHMAQQNLEDIRNVIATKQNYQNEVEMLFPVGTQWVDARLTPVYDAEKNVVGVLGLSYDITRRKMAEKQTREFAEQYDLIKTTELFGYWLLDELGKLIDVNDRYCQMSEYTKEELLNLSIPDLEEIDKPNDVARRIERIIKNGTEQFESKHRTKSGRVFDVGINVVYWPVQKKFIVLIQDITQRKLVEEEIRELNENLESRVRERTRELQLVNESLAREIAERSQTEERIRLVYNASPYSIVLVDSKGIIRMANHTTKEYFGYENAQIIGADVEMLIPKGKDIHHNTKIRNYFTNPEKRKMGAGRELSALKKNGIIFPVEIGLTPIEIRGEKMVLTNIIDITERKLAENKIKKAMLEAEEANRAKSEFLSRMSHELRTPMNSILGFAQLMSMGELMPAHKKRVEHIIKSGKHLLALINEVLDISKIETGHITLLPEPVAVYNLLNEITDIISPMAHEKQVTLEIIPGDKVFVKADRQRLKQVLLNLANNAIKYNHTGGLVKVEVHSPQPPEGQRQEAGDYPPMVRISMTDTGKGITPGDIKKLFTPFQRIGAENTETEGTGLGLAVAKQLTDTMGGKIGVESEPGKGSTFWVEMPLAESGEKQDPQEILAAQADETAQKGGIILYIEDNNSNVELVEQILNDHRKSIRLITDKYGKNTVRLATEYNPDFILLDLNLPDISGYDVMGFLQSNTETKHIPVIVISADAMGENIEKLLNAGATEYLTKPLDVIQFLQVIDKYLGNPFKKKHSN